MALPDPVPAPLAAVLAWLDAEPADDPVVDLANLRARVLVLADPALGDALFLQCVEQFEARALDVGERFKPRLLNAALPLSREMHAAASELVEVLLEIAGRFQQLMDSVRVRWLRVRRSDPNLHAVRGMRLVDQAYLVGAMSGAVAPAGLWSRAYALIAAEERIEGGRDVPPESPAAEAALIFKRLAALAALQPESLTARELVWAHDYLEGGATAAEISRDSVQPASAGFWIDPAADAPPAAVARSEPPVTGELLHFSAYGVARAIAPKLEWLKARLVPGSAAARNTELYGLEGPELPLGLAPAEAMSLLERMRDRWAIPPNRVQTRRPQRYPVQVCAGLRASWEGARPGAEAGSVAEWMVYNESPGGYAIMSVAGPAGVVSAGMPVALRRDAVRPWSLCLVRWVRSDNPEQVELGLQILAHSFDAVSIGFRGGDARVAAPALLLPPMPGLRHNQAIVTAAGTYSARRFNFVHEGDHLYVAQGRVTSFDMQTASMELFQFEIDPYPD